MDKMILSIEAYGNKFIAEISENSLTDDVTEVVALLLEQTGYHKSNIVDAFNSFK